MTESFHGWIIGRVSVRDVFDSVPEQVSLRFLFQGSGHAEGGIDEVRLLDFDGQCLSSARGGFCGCSASSDGHFGDATPVAPVGLLLGLVGLRRVRQRRQRSIDSDSSPVL